MEPVRTLSPKRVQAVLEACRSVKVKRLFLWFAERHAHPWFGRLDLKRIDLGRGKRQIVVGGGWTANIRSLCRRHSMPASEAYRAQVSLLARVLPLVAEENVFALKGARPSIFSLETFHVCRSISI
ncbi:type IV toxin-antitoxin system AbiEi family antitoxin domain-containing protein [Bradyrhizobium elkanii]|uniref:type IV toxin-antitoxin system AbiEi family antitoxin domain-containing protein n=1 Tax=Bradyrhizobium elkanii TaxID=29448 RepID=UPI001FEFE046|nr:type IV toxin-antitoxin system AbiEi family antitoxin domain-containing protein [Bradyrhizobium elkanii]